MRSTGVVPLAVCLIMAAGTVSADEVVIQYRSGKTERFVLSEPSSSIVGIRYQEGAQASPPAVPGAVPGPAGDKVESAVPSPKGTATPQKGPSKPQLRIEWAQPIE